MSVGVKSWNWKGVGVSLLAVVDEDVVATEEVLVNNGSAGLARRTAMRVGVARMRNRGGIFYRLDC